MRHRVAGVAVLAALAACGSTVPRAAQFGATRSAATPGEELAVPTVGAPTDLTSIPTVDVPAAGASSGVAVDGAPVPSTTAPATGVPTTSARGATPTKAPTPVRAAASSARAAQAVKGVTATTITVGQLIVNGASGLADSAGIKGAQTGDQKAIAQAVIDHLNAKGGLAGRRIVPVFYDVNLGSYQANQPGEAQAACTALTQDQPVYAVASYVAWGSEDLYACLDKAGVIVAGTGELTTDALVRRHPDSLFLPSDLTFTRVLRDSVDVLSGAGWFGRSPKTAVVGADSPVAREAVEGGLKPGLAARGLTLDDAAYVGTENYTSTVLRFASEGITHVFFSVGASVLLFAQAANAQGYHPALEVDSRQSPGSYVQGNAPAASLKNAMGLGWSPFLDLDNSRWPAQVTPGRQACFQAAAAAQQNLTDATTALTATYICDEWFFLRDVLSRTKDLSRPGFRAAAEALGTSFAPASTFRSRVSAARHDGADAYHLNVYDEGCSCFTYRGGQLSAP
jgi:hypothetical protein